jgi:DNA-binding transcriptional regulator YiaG
MTPHQFRRVTTKIGLTQVQVAHTLHVTPRTARRWAEGEVAVSPTAAKLLRLIQAGKVSAQDVRNTPA